MGRLILLFLCVIMVGCGDTQNNNDIDITNTSSSASETTQDQRFEKSPCDECTLEQQRANNEMWGAIVDVLGNCYGESAPCDPVTGQEPDGSNAGESRAITIENVFEIYVTSTNTLQNDSTVDPADVVQDFYEQLSAETGGPAA